MKKKTQKKAPKKVLKSKTQKRIKKVIEEPKKKFVFGDYITDTLTGKNLSYHNQHKVDENPDRYILLAPNL